MGKENREVKSSVLVDLMYEDESAEENERSFYNALHEEQLPNNIETVSYTHLTLPTICSV